jgi:ribonuclease PH
VAVEPGFVSTALGSALITWGNTRVICTANLARLPAWREDAGWVTAEYSMLPGAVRPRGTRDPGGRGREIQRLVGRSLRAAIDLGGLVGHEGPLCLVCDTDVIEADGGTRTASITGGFVALAQALHALLAQGILAHLPALDPVLAVSVGVVPSPEGGPVVPMLDLCYEEDRHARVDLNVVMLASGGLVEIQGTAERGTFSREDLDGLLDLAGVGIRALGRIQEEALARVRPCVS